MFAAAKTKAPGDRERRTGRHGASLFPWSGCGLKAPRPTSRAPPMRQAGSS